MHYEVLEGKNMHTSLQHPSRSREQHSHDTGRLAGGRTGEGRRAVCTRGCASGAVTVYASGTSGTSGVGRGCAVHACGDGHACCGHGPRGLDAAAEAVHASVESALSVVLADSHEVAAGCHQHRVGSIAGCAAGTRRRCSEGIALCAERKRRGGRRGR